MPTTRSCRPIPALLAAVGAICAIFVAAIMFIGALDLFFPHYACSSELPTNAKLYLPVLQQQQAKISPDMPMPAWQAAQIHKETCASARHPKCWNPRAELKTSREYGVGLGQITIAYRADGSERFNTFKELKSKYPRLQGWTWENRYDPAYQIDALLLQDYVNYRNVVGAATPLDRIAFTAVAYNGGAGSVLYDRRLCQGTKGCDQSRWFGNVENTSGKSRTVMKGYGRSPYEISRDYPRDILTRLYPLYQPYFIPEPIWKTIK